MAKTANYHEMAWRTQLIDVESVVRDIETIRAANSKQTEVEAFVDHHNLIRDHLETLYGSSFDTLLDAYGRRIHKAIRSGLNEEAAAALFIILSDDLDTDFSKAMARTGAAAYEYAEGMLGEKPWGEPEARAEEFASSRLPDLKGVPEEVLERLRESLDRGLKGGESPSALYRRLDEALEETKTIEGQRLSATETTVALGLATDSILAAAGYTTKHWLSQRDDRVRETHEECDKQGFIPINKKFSNGLRFPGDPNGDVTEIINCRCVLVGGREKPVKASQSDFLAKCSCGLIVNPSKDLICDRCGADTKGAKRMEGKHR